jgi:predicted MPP superfamily phosphohydrolase
MTAPRRPGLSNKVKPLRIIGLTLIVTALALGVWAFAWEPASFVTRTHRVAIPHWRAELAGLRVAVLGDLHVGSPYNGLSKLAEIVDATNRLRPDLILLPGDFVIQEVLGGKFVSPEDASAVLARLKAPLGVWAVLGNHDWWLDEKRVQAALEQHGIRVLEDRAVVIKRGDAQFWLVGISDFWEGPHDVRAATSAIHDDAPVLMFTHNPDVFPTIANRFSLLVAAHTHGGQVHLPLLGRPIVPSAYGQRYAIGHVVENGRHLFVSSGLGTSIIPVRFRVPPEISVLELVPIEQPGS